jgi:hypothetical protein
VTLLTVPAGLAAGGCELGAWLALLVLPVADGCTGAAGWLVGCPALG